MMDADVKASLCELHVLALTLWGEARGESIEGKVFVGSVIRNRVQARGRFGDSYDAVCLARAQFSCWWGFGGKENYAAVMEQARRFAGIADRDGLAKDAILNECLFLAEGIIGGQLRDNSKGADHYLTRELLRRDPPPWTKGRVPVVSVGPHVGFRL